MDAIACDSNSQGFLATRFQQFSSYLDLPTMEDGAFQLRRRSPRARPVILVAPDEYWGWVRYELSRCGETLRSFGIRMDKRRWGLDAEWHDHSLRHSIFKAWLRLVRNLRAPFVRIALPDTDSDQEDYPSNLE